MTDQWAKAGQHPPLSSIFLHLDGVLDESDSADMTQHLNNCWECRAVRDRVQRGIHGFMEYRQEVLLPSVPPSTLPPQVFRQSAREVLAGLQGNSPEDLFRRVARRLLASPRIATGVTATASAVMVIFLVSMPVTHPPRLTAADLIQRARTSAGHLITLDTTNAGHVAKKAVYQKVQLRSGNRMIEREVLLAGATADAEPAPPDEEWARLLAATPIDWRNPLGVERYERWREVEGKGQDTVSEAGGIATLNTVPGRQSPIESASLTVRESDWHPIAKHVNFAGRAPLEVREIDYGVRDITTLEIASAAAKPAIHVIDSALPPAVDGPQPIDLDEIEVRLREALHTVAADLNEAPEIARDGPIVRFRAFAESTERKQEVLASVHGIPYVAAEVSDPGTPSGPPAAAGAQTPDIQMYSTSPPLFKALQDFLGGLDVANTYLHSVRDSYRDALMEASALQRLADRYAGAAWERLQPELRTRINALAAGYIDSARQRSDIYLRQVSIGLDEMLIRSRVTPDPDIAADSALLPCRLWRTDSDAVPNDLHRLETAFQRLFVAEKTDQPLVLSADILLLESAALRARYAADIRQLCPPLEGGK